MQDATCRKSQDRFKICAETSELKNTFFQVEFTKSKFPDEDGEKRIGIFP
jgi:hypothetical protein